MSPRHFLSLLDFSADDLLRFIEDARSMKSARAGAPRGAPDAQVPLAGHVLAMIFEQPSTRTRVSFDVAMRQLGGSTICLNRSDLQLGRGETIADTGRVMSRYVDMIMVRTDSHEKLTALAAASTVPVINGLTPISHPCQILADLMTLSEERGRLDGLTVTWVGDANNVARSWIEAAMRLPFKLRLSSPAAYAPHTELLARARAGGARLEFVQDPHAAVSGADCVVTDTWVSMTHSDREERLRAFGPFQVNEALMSAAKGDAVFLHCLPAHRGEEVSDDVIDGARSRVWDEAENRLHIQKAILKWVAGR